MTHRIDLHTHSNESDGTDRPGELVEKAIVAGVTHLSVTDHDSITGWSEALSHRDDSISLILGAEISCQTSEALSVHMLGLLFDPENQPLRSAMEQTRTNRVTRMERIVTRLQEAGIEITIADVYAELSEGATLGRPHLADAMVKKGIVSDRSEAFERYLHNRSKFYIPDASPTPEIAIGLIKEAGGVAVIAHPFASLRGRIISPEYLESLVDAGLDGIEIDHRDHNEGERDALREMVRRFGLIATGGSDYHGTGKVNKLAENTTDMAQLERIITRATGFAPVGM
ncbi:MAG: PHP domain-containing protein [Candidatus Nanopelagicaceae bacterium]|jgi:predicted metal-dependent phosphoesterase TrpH